MIKEMDPDAEDEPSVGPVVPAASASEPNGASAPAGAAGAAGAGAEGGGALSMTLINTSIEVGRCRLTPG